MKKLIATALSPNTQKDDIKLAFKLLFSPKIWIKGEAPEILENTFKDWLPAKYAFTFVSGRACLYVILSALNLQKNDEVLLQAFTCAVVPEAILWAGAKPIYVDIDSETLNISLADLEKKITPKSRVLIVQHTFGLPALLPELLAIAKKHHLFIIEDCAHSLGTKFENEKTGTFGDAAFFSFGRDKVISSVWGGMIATNNADLAAKILEFQKKAKYPKKWWLIQQLLHPLILGLIKSTYNFFYLGKIILAALKKLQVISGPVDSQNTSPFKMPNALALLALNQFKKLEKFNNHRRALADLYNRELKDLDFKIIPSPDKSANHIYLRYTVLTEKADELRKKAKKENIYLGDWYSTAISPPGTDYEKIYYRPESCPVAEKIAPQTLNLPTHINISENDALRIIEFLKKNL